MTIVLGTRLGPYEVIAAIGAGGMGEVYRAKDSRLGREVALKVVPENFLDDEDRKARFDREARVLAAMNHPGIAALYSFEEIPGSPGSSAVHVLAMELLEGETLRQRLAGGALPTRKAVDFAVQIARALAAAHEKGVVHRDLKPENLFVTKDGRIKILDFGLAKVVESAAGSGGTNLPTMSKGTEPGAVLGTLGYMSPEQLRGLPADHRTDLFSFGAVLYEMLSGRKAFRDDTAADTVSAILKEEPPDLSATNRTIPPALERIVRHCLEKSPDERAHSAHDLAFDLESLSAASSGPAAPLRAAAAIRRPSARALAVAAACLAAGSLGGRLFWKTSVPAPPTFHRLTFRRGNVLSARFAPDGRTIVYGAAWGGRPSEIFTVRTEGPESRPLGLPNASVLSVSSGGELAILTRESMSETGSFGTLARVPLSGGAPRALLEEVSDADWMPDGKELAVIRNREGGGRRIELPAGKVLYESPKWARSLRISPDGSSVAFVEAEDQGSSLRVVDRAGKVRTLAGPMPVFSGRFAWSPSGREIWYFGGSDRKDAALRAVDLAGRIRTLYRSTGTLFVHDIFPDGRVLLGHAAGVRGVMFGRAGDKAETELSWFDGSRVTSVAAGGRAVLFNEDGVAMGGRPQAFFRKTDGSPAVRLADGEALALSPDATRVLLRAGDVLTLAPVGAGTPIPVALGSVSEVMNARFFPDGKRILLHGFEKGKPPRYWIVDPPTAPRAASPEGLLGSARLLSPDGRWMIGWSADTSVLSVCSTEGAPARPLPGTEHDDIDGWTADSRAIYVRPAPGQGRQLYTLDVTTLVRKPWKELVPPDAASVTAVPEVVFATDGSAYAYTYQRVLTSDLYVVEGLK
jgi:tRNA A-37 threonylcarbamoyl transferase component Bud32/dipeptidyl aminopeptidase/acylaminoacyl peptidase